jgi:P27 family predicted phage terminase small subunit
MRGTYRDDRHGSRLSRLGSGRPIRPSRLTGDARKHWQTVVPPLVAAGVVEKVDTPALTSLAELWAAYRATYAAWCAEPKNKKARADMLEFHRAWSTMAQQFGLTPAARTKLQIPPRSDDDQFEEHLRKQKFFR